MTPTEPVSPSAPSFEAIFNQTQHRQAVCMLALLTWVASCDGRIAPKERALLDKVAESVEDVEDLAAVEASVRLNRADDLAIACRYLKTNLDRGGKRLLVQLAVTMAIADGSLSVGENHLLQFIADLLGVRPRAFSKLFQQVTHRPFPQAGDLSSPDWWRKRESGSAVVPVADPAIEQDTAEEEKDPDGAMTRRVALNVLGLDDGVPHEKIHAAYRRLAKARHPDRFSPLGPAAVATATEGFKRLHEAYSILAGGRE